MQFLCVLLDMLTILAYTSFERNLDSVSFRILTATIVFHLPRLFNVGLYS